MIRRPPTAPALIAALFGAALLLGSERGAAPYVSEGKDSTARVATSPAGFHPAPYSRARFTSGITERGDSPRNPRSHRPAGAWPGFAQTPGSLALQVLGNFNSSFSSLNPRQREMAANLLRRRMLPRRGVGGAEEGDVLLPWICFAPGTAPEVVEALSGSLHGHLAPQSVSSGEFRAAATQYFSTPRWTDTDTNNTNFFNPLGQGDATVLTWSIVNDGLSIPGDAGEPTSPSNLRARLNALYAGGEAEWLPLFEQVFERWSELTGVKYIYQPNDSGGFPNRSGNNSRGDIRIAGHPIDGDFGTLAYNFGPNGGDMVIDTDDAYFDSKTNNSRRLRNVVAHEHGHGLGLAHVCPQDFTKLMEPNAVTSFDGPQLDDIYSAQRQYGDRLEDPDFDASAENNDALSRAADLGTLGAGSLLVEHLSIDDNSDVDYLQFTPAVPNMVLSVELRAIGESYPEGAQSGSQPCAQGSGSLYDSLSVHDLSLQVLDAAGGVLANLDATDSGEDEVLSDLQLGDGDVVLRISGDSSDACQLYELQIQLLDPIAFPNISLVNSTANEGDATMVFVVHLDSSPTIEARVDVTISGVSATDGEDFFGGSTFLSFPPGVIQRTLAVNLLDDTEAEADETLEVVLSNPQYLQLSDSSALGTILDNDPDPRLQNSITISRQSEGGGQIGWLAIPGRTYRVDYSEDLKSWFPLPGYESTTPTTETPSLPIPSTSPRFYRVVEIE